jgi:hypothetical protein
MKIRRRRRTFDQIRAETRAQISIFIDNYAERQRSEGRGEVAAVLGALSGTIRSDLVASEREKS